VLRLYQRWQRTKSHAAAARLAALGVVPGAVGRRTPAVSGRARERRASILSRLQLGLEALRVPTDRLRRAFVIDDEQRRARRGARREQLLVREQDGELLALFIDGAALANLERHDPNRRLDDANFADFCGARGVSHRLPGLCAPTSARLGAGLELQAEVDKFVCCVLLQGPGTDLRRRLFDDVRFHDDLDADERPRYRWPTPRPRATPGPEAPLVREDRVHDMLAELRQFYRMGIDEARADCAPRRLISR
jgi:hypothetical protein